MSTSLQRRGQKSNLREMSQDTYTGLTMRRELRYFELHPWRPHRDRNLILLKSRKVLSSVDFGTFALWNLLNPTRFLGCLWIGIRQLTSFGIFTTVAGLVLKASHSDLEQAHLLGQC
jgi:hypothetical protein